MASLSVVLTSAPTLARELTQKLAPKLALTARYYRRRLKTRHRRYRNLLAMVHRFRPRTILEVGVFKGKHAQFMIETACLFHPPEEIHYFGFDLFEHQTAEDFVREFAKKPPSRADVEARLAATGAGIELFAGYSDRTLAEFRARSDRPSIDLAFIDGGHSRETILSDWLLVRPLMSAGGVVLFDDYLRNDEPEMKDIGCQYLIEELSREAGLRVEVLEPEDHFEKSWGTLNTSIAVVYLPPS